MDYAELEIASNFSFLKGASHADELAFMAQVHGLKAFALTDENTVAGLVRGHVAAKDSGLRYIPGCKLVLQNGLTLLAYPTDRAAYGRMTRLLTLGNRRAEKGACLLDLTDVETHCEGLIFAVKPQTLPPPLGLLALRKRIQAPLYVALSPHYDGRDQRRIAFWAHQAKTAGLPLLATGDVCYHIPDRRSLMDVMTCISKGCTLDSAGDRLAANGERFLKPGHEMARLFKGYETALEASLEIMEAAQFSLESLSYDYPDEPVPPGETPQSQLKHLALVGAKTRYPEGIPQSVSKAITYELSLIEDLGYAPYFLTVHDIVQFARARGILCQGRGSAANSVVCYCLGVTAVDPTRIGLLFERFISKERDEPPDIDVDFEHSRREEVIQYIYARYGRHRAALAATVIRYRAKSAARDVGKVMGLSEDTITALTSTVWGSYGRDIPDERVREAGLDPDAPRIRETLILAHEIMGMPRHLSQHVGGFVLTQTPLTEVVPVQNAAMENRTVVEWDKDDLDALNILKIDVLALGMLTALKDSFTLLDQHYGLRHSLQSLPVDDPAVYAMLRRADSIGVFQVESRAQMSMLPRLKPKTFYDLVVQVAIVRPGPIQGNMVHPYLRRRKGLEPVDFPSPDPAHGPADELKHVLANTYGVPLFQEQAMKIAIVAAGFSPGEADALRRAMASFRNTGTIHVFRDRFITGMTGRGYEHAFAERCFQQIEGFADYGFPESHAASFALLVEASAWVKCHYPAVFLASLLNAQPMGFYAPAQLVRDAREHGVEVRPVDINHSLWRTTLEPQTDPKSPHKTAVRLGFRQVKGLKEDSCTQLVAERYKGYDTVEDLHIRSRLSRPELEILAEADCFRSVGKDRRAALWEVRALMDAPDLPLFRQQAVAAEGEDPVVTLAQMPLGEQVVSDYQTLRLSLKAHPLGLLRHRLDPLGVSTAAQLTTLKDGARVSLAGLVLVRQRPGSAKGVLFMTLEDETGVANIVVWASVFEGNRRAVMGSRLLIVKGQLQREDGVLHLVAKGLEDRSELLLDLSETPDTSTVMDPALARSDEVKRGTQDGRRTHPNSQNSKGATKAELPPFRARRHPRMVRNLVPRSRDFH